MASETTPLSKITAGLTKNGNDNKPFTKSMLKSQLENAEVVGKKLANQVKEGAKDAWDKAAAGKTSIRVLALVGGVALVIDGITGFLKDATTLDIGQSFLDIYITLLGVIAVILESPKAAIPYATKVRRFLSSNMPFLQFVTGRGFTYFLAGTLELNQEGTFSNILAIYMIVVGMLYYYVGFLVDRKVSEFRKEVYSDKQMKKKFDEFDADGDGYLTFPEFQQFVNTLGLQLTEREAELLFVPLDKSLDNSLSYDEFMKFWSESEFESHKFVLPV